MSDFTLSYADKNSQLWLRFRAYLEERLADARQRNDATQSELATATLRGEIAVIKQLIALDEDPAIATGDTRHSFVWAPGGVDPYGG